MKLVEESRSPFGIRRLARVGLAGVGLVLLTGLFSSTQAGCLSPDQYLCGVKKSNNQCWSFTQQADCQTHPICEWRVGCASGCQRATTNLECSQHIGCEVGGAPERCFRSGCRLPTNGREIMTEAECSVMQDCNWEPSCWDAANTDCDISLSQTECERRNCIWQKQDSSL